MSETAPNLSKILQETESRIVGELFSMFQQFELNRNEAEARTASVLSGVWNALETRIRALPPRRKAA